MVKRNAASIALALLLGACSSESSDTVTLTLDPAGAVEVTGPQRFVATAANTRDEVAWALDGPGSLSATSGREVVYRPPSPPPVGETATLTASVSDASASATITLGRPLVDSATIDSLTAPVEVLYDEKDVPHIRCEAVNDCLAVQGYLHARDRLFQMDFLRRVALGRAAELVGAAALSQDVQLRTLFTTRDGRRLEEALADAMEAGTRAKVEAYVAGVNAYLAAMQADPDAELPGEYAQLPYSVTFADIPDWTVADVAALARLQQFNLSESIGEETDYGVFAAAFGPGGPYQDLGKLNTWIRAAQPIGAQAHTVTPTRTVTKKPLIAPAAPRRAPKRVPKKAPAPPLLASWGRTLGGLDGRLAALASVLTPLDGAFGSNNWVVAATHSASGYPMVANDPHLSLQYPPNFYLAALTSSDPADNLDVTGGAFPGVPGAQVGRGKNVAWGVTVVGYDVTDLYLEQAVPCPEGTPAAIPFCVSFNGAAVWVLPVEAKWRVRTASGLVDATSGVPAGIAVVPQHGPIIQAPDGTGRAVSVRWTGHESWTQDFNAFLGLNTAADVDSAMAALEDYATGAQNFVLADDQGHIAYYPHALVPVRRFADPTSGETLRPPWLPLPGDGSAEWGTGNPADNCAGVSLGTFPPTPVQPAAACWVAKTDLPQGKDPAKGFFATANSDPLGVSDSNNPLASPPYLSFDWSDPTGLRITQIVNRLTELTADGGKVTLEDMQDLQADHSSLLGKMFAAILAAPAFADLADANTDFAAGRAALLSWAEAGAECPTGLVDIDPASAPDPDEAVAASSAGCYLFHAFLRSLVDRVFADDLALAGLDVSGGPAVRGILHMLHPDTPAADQTFCNDVTASDVTSVSCGAQVATALVTAYRTLAGTLGDPSNWRWGRVHTMQPTSLFPLVTRGYSPGPYARPGGAFTVDVANPSLDADSRSFAFYSSANVRHVSVMDPAAPVVKMQLPGPERSVPAGVFTGPDLLAEWVRNEYFDFAHGAQIDAVAVSSQDFAR